MIGRLAAVFREQGVRGTWFGALAWARVYRRLELVELPLHRLPPLAPAAATLRFGFLTPAELDALGALDAGPVTAEAGRRLERGDRCFVARDGLEIVSSRWVASGRAHIVYLDRSLDLAAGDAYVYETHTRPERRGEGVSAAAGTRLAHAMADEGYRRLVAAVLRENHRGTRAYQKAGYRRIGRIGYVRLGPWRRDFRHTTRDGTGA